MFLTMRGAAISRCACRNTKTKRHCNVLDASFIVGRTRERPESRRAHALEYGRCKLHGGSDGA